MLMMKEVSKTCVLNMIQLVLTGNSCYFFILSYSYLFIYFLLLLYLFCCAVLLYKKIMLFVNVCFVVCVFGDLEHKNIFALTLGQVLLFHTSY